MDQKIVPLVGRVLLAHIFLFSGTVKIMAPGQTQEYMAAAGMPFTLLFLIGAIILELGGGISVLLGLKARWGAAALVLFLIPTTLIFHLRLSDPMQQSSFMKNVAIMGGLLMVCAYGAGKMSIDGLITQRKET